MADLYTLTAQALLGLQAEGGGLELVDVERAPMGLLRVTVDRAGGVRIEDCEQVSRHLSRVYEVENIDYRRLEVGSPGVDRPLRSQGDLLRFAGERVEVKLRQAIDNRKVYAGVLRLAQAPDEAGRARFDLEFEAKKNETQVVTFTFDDIERAKLDPVLDFKGKKR